MHICCGLYVILLNKSKIKEFEAKNEEISAKVSSEFPEQERKDNEESEIREDTTKESIEVQERAVSQVESLIKEFSSEINNKEIVCFSDDEKLEEIKEIKQNQNQDEFNLLNEEKSNASTETNNSLIDEFQDQNKEEFKTPQETKDEINEEIEMPENSKTVRLEEEYKLRRYFPSEESSERQDRNDASTEVEVEEFRQPIAQLIKEIMNEESTLNLLYDDTINEESSEVQDRKETILVEEVKAENLIKDLDPRASPIRKEFDQMPAYDFGTTYDQVKIKEEFFDLRTYDDASEESSERHYTKESIMKIQHHQHQHERRDHMIKHYIPVTRKEFEPMTTYEEKVKINHTMKEEFDHEYSSEEISERIERKGLKEEEPMLMPILEKKKQEFVPIIYEDAIEESSEVQDRKATIAQENRSIKEPFKPKIILSAPTTRKEFEPITLWDENRLNVGDIKANEKFTSITYEDAIAESSEGQEGKELEDQKIQVLKQFLPITYEEAIEESCERQDRKEPTKEINEKEEVKEANTKNNEEKKEEIRPSNLQEEMKNDIFYSIVAECKNNFALTKEYYWKKKKVVESFLFPYKQKKLKKLFLLGDVEGAILEFDHRYNSF